MNEVVVIFRKDTAGVCFAIFPELPSDAQGDHCTAYVHLGPHCAADYDHFIARSTPAAPAEYADLSRELAKRGYILSIRSRATPEMHERRRRIAAEWRGVALRKQLASATR
jgi:hypothetical protein